MCTNILAHADPISLPMKRETGEKKLLNEDITFFVVVLLYVSVVVVIN